MAGDRWPTVKAMRIFRRKKGEVFLKRRRKEKGVDRISLQCGGTPEMEKKKNNRFSSRDFKKGWIDKGKQFSRC